jgi:hypothetical protein
LAVKGSVFKLQNNFFNSFFLVFVKVESKCPKLSLVYFTRRPGDKALGWSDVVMMQSMREPTLLPCGHVGDATSLRLIRAQICPICRTPYTADTLVKMIGLFDCKMLCFCFLFSCVGDFEAMEIIDGILLLFF